MRRWLGGWGVLLVGALVAGCGVFGTGDDERRAREVAEEVLPGKLTVIGARTLVPETTGSEITFSLADDPDAAVVLRVDADKDRCDGGGTCAEALRKAVERGRSQGEHLRLMREAFEECGHPVLAVDQGLSTPWVEAEPTNGNLDEVLAEIGACVERWTTARAARPDAESPRWVSVAFAAPGTAARLPSAEEDRPTLLRLTHRPRLAALAGVPYHVAAYPVAPGAGGGAEAGTPTLRLVAPFEQREAFSRQIDASVLPELRRTHPDAVTTGGAGMGVWRLEPGRIDRMRGHVLFCARPPADGKRCLGDLAAVVTSDTEGRHASVLDVLTDIRDERGVLRLPPP
ncbi:SCO7460 family lipoprotein [Streptomyces tagetis]|uniref:Lipoprotein n=1 Tax=Streptomyces tagetis TaxID=2820809 RepID=A0A940XNR9_9ACTN|nr:hypothetical protein [Streptomyces sp. RG38]MBQ0827063.1 hypothetical protein [Streptomyces sp. RG38]